MKLYDAINSANQQGRLGLVVYAIPNFPDPLLYQKIHQHLVNEPCVSVIETTFPVKSLFSDHANSTIRTSHRVAAAHEKEIDSILNQYHFPKASLSVLYQETNDQYGFEFIMKKMKGKIDGVLLEWNETDIETYVEYSKISANYGVEFVHCIGPNMSHKELQTVLSYCKPNALVYLMSAEMTGGALYSSEILREVINRAKSIRLDIKVAAGFGIRTSSQIRALSQISELDAVIIGTAFLEKIAKGEANVKRYLNQIQEGLSYVTI